MVNVFLVSKELGSYSYDYFEGKNLLLYDDEFACQNLPDLGKHYEMLDVKQLDDDEYHSLYFVSCPTDKAFVSLLSEMNNITVREIDNVKVLSSPTRFDNIHVGKSICILWEPQIEE